MDFSDLSETARASIATAESDAEAMFDADQQHATSLLEQAEALPPNSKSDLRTGQALRLKALQLFDGACRRASIHLFNTAAGQCWVAVKPNKEVFAAKLEAIAEWVTERFRPNPRVLDLSKRKWRFRARAECLPGRTMDLDEALKVGSPNAHASASVPGGSCGPAALQPSQIVPDEIIVSKYAREARSQIIAAFERLGVRPEVYSKLVGPEPVPGDHTLVPNENDYFIPPVFNRLEQSLEEWSRDADALWQKHRDALMKKWRLCELMVDTVLRLKRRRGSGRTGRNAEPEKRYEWAALRLMGLPYKEIASRSYNCKSETQLRRAENKVRKAVADLLQLAGLEASGIKNTDS